MTQPVHPAVAALSAAIENAAGLTRVAGESITVESLQATEWPDGCLGLPEDDEACTDAVTPGYLIKLGDGFTYRADQHGNVRRERGHQPHPDTEIRLRYTRTGGITGRVVEYETDSYQLTKAEHDELSRLIGDADFFNIKNAPPGPVVADGQVMTLWIAVGRRNHEVIRGDGIDMEDTDAFRALAGWVADRAPKLYPGSAIYEG